MGEYFFGGDDGNFALTINTKHGTFDTELYQRGKKRTNCFVDVDAHPHTAVWNCTAHAVPYNID